jgi:hypothetical protein
MIIYSIAYSTFSAKRISTVEDCLLSITVNPMHVWLILVQSKMSTAVLPPIMTSQTPTETGTDVTKGKDTVVSLVIMLCAFSVSGVIGNAVVLFVFGKRSDGLGSTFFILLLATIDFITSLIIMPATAYMEYFDMKIGDHDLLCKLYQFSLTSVIPLSALIMTAIAVDR